MVAAIAGASDFYAAGGDSPTGFISKLYSDLLSRSPSSAELAGNALHQREMSLARSKLAKAFRVQPSPRRAFLFVVSLLPVFAINLRRRWRQRGSGLTIDG